MIEKQSVIKLSRYSSKSYASVVLSDSKAVLEKWRIQPFIYSFIVFLYRYCSIIEEKCRNIFLSFILQEVFRRGLQLFCFGFFLVVLSCYSVNSPKLMTINIFFRFIPDFIGLGRSRFLKCSFHL